MQANKCRFQLETLFLFAFKHEHCASKSEAPLIPVASSLTVWKWYLSKKKEDARAETALAHDYDDVFC